jgi:hypothetical protein
MRVRQGSIGTGVRPSNRVALRGLQGRARFGTDNFAVTLIAQNLRQTDNSLSDRKSKQARVNSEIVELPCSPEVERIVSQIVRANCSHGKNTIWISTFAPDTDAHVWTWKAIAIDRTTGQSLLKLLQGGKKQGGLKKDE